MLVVVFDNLLRVIHATVTDLDGVVVEDFSCRDKSGFFFFLYVIRSTLLY